MQAGSQLARAAVHAAEAVMVEHAGGWRKADAVIDHGKQEHRIASRRAARTSMRLARACL